MPLSHRRRPPCRRRAVALAPLLVAAPLFGATASADAAPVDRRIGLVHAVPSADAPGIWDLAVEWEIELLDPVQAPADTSFDIAFIVNGSLVAMEHVPAVWNEIFLPSCSCGDPCGRLNGTEITCKTSFDRIQGCSCVPTGIETLPGGLALQPGDEIRAMILPSPGTLPDDPAGNVERFVFTGEPRTLLRRFGDVEVEVTDDEIVLDVEIVVGTFGIDEPVGTGTIVRVETADGNLLLPSDVFNRCPNHSGLCDCEDLECDGPVACPLYFLFHRCETYHGGPEFDDFCRCVRRFGVTFVVPRSAVLPGEPLRLRIAAEGGLADLDPHADELLIEIPSSDPPCGADLDCDDTVGFGDLVTMLADWGPCPDQGWCWDFDGDGAVGFADLLHLLLQWD